MREACLKKPGISLASTGVLEYIESRFFLEIIRTQGVRKVKLMADYVLTTCSTVDLSPEYLEKIHVPFVCFHYELGGESHPDDLWATMDPHTFYQRMLAGEESRTSQINMTEYIDFWRPFLEQGKDLLHLTLSSGISGTVNSARAAAEELRKEFPDREILVVDSLAASSGFGLLIDRLAELRDQGYSLKELHRYAEDHKLYLHHWFFSTDLTFYIRGGRVSKTAGFFGRMLNICPLLNVDYQGRLIPRDKIRTKKKVIREIVARMEEHAQDGAGYSGKVFISHSDCLEDAQAVASLVEQKFPGTKGKVTIFPIGSTIGAHTGPGTVALFFWGDLRNN